MFLYYEELISNLKYKLFTDCLQKHSLYFISFSLSAGKLTDMHGNAYRYDANVKHMNSAGVLATLRNHEYYVSRVPQSVRQALKTD